MISEGYGGRSARYYGPWQWTLGGVTVDDPPKKPKPGWNKRRYTYTPWGMRPASGAIFLRCGNCSKQIWPVSAGERQCRCDF